MFTVIRRIDAIDQQAALQIMDQGYGQVEVYVRGTRTNQVFLSPAEINELYGKNSSEEAQAYLKSIR